MLAYSAAVTLMGLLTADSASVYCRPTGIVSEEIDLALRLHHTRGSQAHGLILGLEKYRQLRQQHQAITASVSYNGLAIIVDASQLFRISVF